MKKGLTATLNRGAAGGLVKDEKNIKAKKDLEDLLNEHKALLWQAESFEARMKVAQMFFWKMIAIYDEVLLDTSLCRVYGPILIGVIDQMFHDYVMDHAIVAKGKGDQYYPDTIWFRLWVANRLKGKILKRDREVLQSFLARRWGAAASLLAIQAKEAGSEIGNDRVVVWIEQPKIHVIHDEKEYQRLTEQDIGVSKVELG